MVPPTISEADRGPERWCGLLKGVKVSRTKRLVLGAVLVFMSFLLLGSGGSISRGAGAWSGQHIVAVGADVHAIMATGACKPGAAVGG